MIISIGKKWNQLNKEEKKKYKQKEWLFMRKKE